MMVLESVPHQVTLIHSFSTPLARGPLERLAQDRLVDAPGFRGLALHSSLDGERIVAYAQWEDEVSYRGALSRFAQNPDAHEQFHALLKLPNEPHLYTVDQTLPEEIDPIIARDNELVAVIDVIQARPGGQNAAIRSLKTLAEFFIARSCGFVCATYHCGLDGVHVASYSQWDSAQDYEAAWTLARRFGLLDSEDIYAREGRAYHVGRVFEGKLSKPVTQHERGRSDRVSMTGP